MRRDIVQANRDLALELRPQSVHVVLDKVMQLRAKFDAGWAAADNREMQQVFPLFGCCRWVNRLLETFPEYVFSRHLDSLPQLRMTYKMRLRIARASRMSLRKWAYLATPGIPNDAE